MIIQNQHDHKNRKTADIKHHEDQVGMVHGRLPHLHVLGQGKDLLIQLRRAGGIVDLKMDSIFSGGRIGDVYRFQLRERLGFPQGLTSLQIEQYLRIGQRVVVQ